MLRTSCSFKMFSNSDISFFKNKKEISIFEEVKKTKLDVKKIFGK